MAEELTASARPAHDSSDRVRRLVERAQQGDRVALEELYLIHFDRIYSYLHMSVGNRHDAEDLTTQVFVKMLESIGRFRWRSAPFSAWLFRRSEEHTSELQSQSNLVCRLLLEKKKKR